MKKGIICVLVCMLMILSTIVPVSGTVLTEKTSHPLTKGNILYVGGLGPNNYTKIQDAINDASDGDTVFVYDDSSPYFENLVIEKSLNLIGETRETTVIDGNQQEDKDVILIKADEVTVRGFTIQNASIKGGYPDYDNGIEIWSNNNIITDNIIRDTTMGIQLGEEVKYQDHENNHSNFNLIEGNSIIDNHFAGVYVIFSDNNEIVRNTISGNAYHGVFLDSDSSRNKVSQNIITNHNQVGILIGGGTNNTIVGNHIVGNKWGVSILYSSLNSINHNNIFNNSRNAVVQADSLNLLMSRLLYHERIFDQTWDENYWGRPYLGPKPIMYALLLLIPTYFIQILNIVLGTQLAVVLPIPHFDWHPAQEPYDIPLRDR